MTDRPIDGRKQEHVPKWEKHIRDKSNEHIDTYTDRQIDTLYLYIYVSRVPVDSGSNCMCCKCVIAVAFWSNLA